MRRGFGLMLGMLGLGMPGVLACSNASAPAAEPRPAVEIAAAPAIAIADSPPEPPPEPKPEPELVLASGSGAVRPDVQPIEDPSGRALASFHAALARTDARTTGAVTRVLHLGDSSIGLDGLPHAIRRRMQGRFGDAGAGFLLVDRYSPNYKNRAAAIVASVGWDICYIAYLCKDDGHYGLGGHTFRGARGARSVISTLRDGEVGRSASRVELWYAGAPGGGRIGLRVDRAEPIVLDTAGASLEDRWHDIDVEPGHHTIEVAHKGGGYVRLYGLVVENDGPGVVWDSVSMIGAFTKRLHDFDDGHIARQVEHRDPDLLVLNYGGNDLRRIVSRSVDPAGYTEELRVVIRKLRAGKPGLPCLVVGVIDHARSGKRDVLPRHVASMIGAQREAAFAEGCAFFDSVAAMGGPGSIREWLRRQPSLAEPDLKHLNARGRERMGQMMYEALMASYEASTVKRPRERG